MLEYHFNKVADLHACKVFKKRLQHRCFPVNITKSLRTPILKIISERLLLSFKVFCKDFVNISYGNASFGILKDTIWLELIYFLTTIAFSLMKYLYRIDGECWLKILFCVVFIAQISHHENSRHCIN